MFFHALTIAGSQGSCLNPKMLGRVFKHLPRDPASVNAMKQTCVIVYSCIILSYFSIIRAENVAYTLNIHFLTLYFLKHNGVSVKLSNVITSAQRHMYACNVFANESIGEMISYGRSAFSCNVMHTNRGQVKAFSSKSHVQTARESHDLNMDFAASNSFA